MRDILKWAGRHCKQRSFESILIIFIICLGVAAIVSIFSIVNTMQADLNRNHLNISYRTFYINSGISLDPVASIENPLVMKSSTQTRTDLINVTLDDLVNFKTNLPAGAYVFVESSPTYSTSQLPTNQLNVTGFSADAIPFYAYDLALGNWFQDLDVENRNRVAVIGSELAKGIFQDETQLGQQLIITTPQEDQLSYEIIGVLKPTNPQLTFRDVDHMVFMPVTVIPSLITNPEPTFSRFSVGVGSNQELATFYEHLCTQVELQFAGNAQVTGNFTRQYEEDQEIFETYSVIATFASCGLLIAVINILNLMIGRVMRRQKGIGLSRALGASKRTVFVQILSESAILGLIGTTCGIGLSFGVISMFEVIMEAPMIFGFKAIVLGLSLGLAASTLFGIYPAYQGTMVNPIDTLREE